MSAARRSSVVYTLVLLAVLLGFALRVYRLDGQSLWSDEGASAFMTGRNVTQILEASAGDIHPPLYYLLLRAWSAPAGTSEFSLRYLSLAFGLAFIALTYRLGKDLFGLEAGLVAAFFAAISPLAVYYSQEARMYTLMALLGTASVYFLWRLLTGWQERRYLAPPVAGYIASSTALLYTQYFSFSLILMHNVVFVAVFWQVWRCYRRWLAWAAVQVTIALFFLPWLLRVQQSLRGWPAASQPFTLSELLQRAFLAFNVGPLQEALSPDKSGVLLIVLGAGLVWPLLRRRDKDLMGLLFVGLYLLLPLLAMYAVSLQRPMYDAKFLFLALPAYLLLVGLGVIDLSQAIVASVRHARVGAVAVAAVAFLGLGYLVTSPLWAYYQDARYSRDDYRGLARYIELTARPADAILLNAPGQIEIFDYYYRGGLSRYPLPRERPLDPEETVKEVQEIARNHGRIWTVLWATKDSDPQGIIEGWLDRNAFRTLSRWYGNVQMVLYTTSTQEGRETAVEATFGGKIALLGYRLEASRAKAGEVLPLTLLWQAKEPVGERYVVFTHLIDRHEHLWGQHDAPPSEAWQQGKAVADRHGLPIYIGTPPGEYFIEAGIYRPGDGGRLAVTSVEGQPVGDRLILGTVTLGKADPPPKEAIFPQHLVKASFGDIQLLGYDLTRLGSDEPASDFRRGEAAHLTLYWRAEHRPSTSYEVLVELRAESGQVALRERHAPVEGDYPTDGWDEGEIVRDQHKFVLDLPPGRYELLVGMSEAGKSGKPLKLGSIRLE